MPGSGDRNGRPGGGSPTSTSGGCASTWPAAFRTVVLARIYDLPGPIMRLLVSLSTACVLAGVFA